MLAGSREWLGDLGLYVPKTGRTGSQGHHLLAWELNRRRGLNGSTQFDTLRREIRGAGRPARVVLSSEDFSSRIHDPKSVARLERKVRRIGYEPQIICYVRPQESAIQSIYTQRAKTWGVTTGFGDYWPESIKSIQFDYNRRFEALLSSESLSVQFFPFSRPIIEQGICRHFLSTIGVPAEHLAGFVEPLPSNATPDAGTMALSLAVARELARRGIELSKEQREGAASLLRRIDLDISANAGKFNALTSEIIERIRMHFRDSNRRFAARAFGRSWEDVFSADLGNPACVNVFDPTSLGADERRRFDDQVGKLADAISELVQEDDAPQVA
jgi:hypothetical protein